MLLCKISPFYRCFVCLCISQVFIFPILFSKNKVQGEICFHNIQWNERSRLHI